MKFPLSFIEGQQGLNCPWTITRRRENHSVFSSVALTYSMSNRDSQGDKRLDRILKIEATEEERETRRRLFPDYNDFQTKRLQCTVCMEVIGPDIFSKSSVYCHPHLNVLVCKACYDFYGNGDFSMDEDGLDKYCRWCGQGGTLYVCSDCPVAFCKKCIKQNLPRGILRDIEKDDWKCFICNPKPLYELRATCWAVKRYIIKQMSKKKPNDRRQAKIHTKDSCLSSNPTTSTKFNVQELLDFSILDSAVEGRCVEENKLAHMFLQSMGSEVKMEGHRLSKRINLYLDKYVRANEEPTFKHLERAVISFNKTIVETIQDLQQFQERLAEYMVEYKKSIQVRMDTESPKPELILIDESPIEEQIKNQEIEVNRLSDSEKEKENKVENNLEDSNPDSGCKKKFILRIRNVEELNNAYSQDKEENLVVIKDVNMKHVNDDTVNKDEKDDPPKEPVEENKDKEKQLDLEAINILDSDVVIAIEKSNCDQNGSLQPSNDNRINDVEPTNNDDLVKNMEGCKDKQINGDLSDENISKLNQEKESAMNLILKSSSDGSISDSEGSLDSDHLVRKKQLKKKLSQGIKKLRAVKENKDNSIFSSSDDEIDRLVNISSLKKKRKLISDESDYSSSINNSSGKEQRIKKKPRSVKKKRKDSESSLAECLKSGDDSDSRLSVQDIFCFKNATPPQIDMGSIARMALEATSNTEAEDSDITVSNGEKEKITPKNNDLGINILEKMKQCKSFQKETCSCNAIIKSISLVTTDSDDDDNSNSFDSVIKKNSAWKRDKLLNEKLTDTDSSALEEKYEEHKSKLAAMEISSSEDDIFTDKDITSRKKNMVHRVSKISSDSSSSGPCFKTSSSDSESSKSTSSSNQKNRKRIHRVSDSEESGDMDSSVKVTDSGGKGRKNIRKLLKKESLEKSTQAALKEEQERKKRIAERQKLYNKMIELGSEEYKQLDKLVLDFDPETKEELLSVNKDLVKLMKPHQAEGVKFMWDACFESLKDAKKSKGSGCILAHCMGLGKSFQVVSLVHTLLTNAEISVKTVLIICPLSTVLNWVNEFKRWLKGVGSSQDVEVFHMVKTHANLRSYKLNDWYKSGGVMILGYNLFRSMAGSKSKVKENIKKVFTETLLDPGPDLIICDEGHVLKKEQTELSKAVSKIRTLRRIVLTGTPLQNNLDEYHCMVQFVKPNLLGSKKEFKNQFAHPIQNGQFVDSTPHDVKVMKRRAHVLHKILDGVVQRKDYSVLKPYLPVKFEYVISLLLSESQCKLYQYYLDNLARGGGEEKTKGSSIFSDWQCLSRICTHPRALLMHYMKDQELAEDPEDSEGSLKEFVVESSEDSSSGKSDSSIMSINSSESEKKRGTRNKPTGVIEPEAAPVRPERSQWWSDLISEEQFEDIKQSPKFVLLFSILNKCEEIGDKLIVFSQSLVALNLIEYFLSRIHEDTQLNTNSPGLCGYTGSWTKGLDYFRLDGQTASELRSTFIKSFNHEDNTRARLFLISTKAGGMGVNLVGANRVVLFDASWNPSHDVQSIFRIYRFGQKKPCYIYRFLSQGTMEEKIYERQVAKLSTSARVIDEQQIDRHFSHSDLSELYTFTPNNLNADKPTPNLPKDRMMAELVQTYGDIIWNHHQHDSLLDHIEEEELNEEERQQAWQDFENEKNPPPQPNTNQFNPFSNIVQKLMQKNPNLAAAQLHAAAREIYRNYQSMYSRGAESNNAMKTQQGVLRPNQELTNITSRRMPAFDPVTKCYKLSNAALNLNSATGHAGPSQPIYPQRPVGQQGNSALLPTLQLPNTNKPPPTIDPVVHQLD